MRSITPLVLAGVAGCAAPIQLPPGEYIRGDWNGYTYTNMSEHVLRGVCGMVSTGLDPGPEWLSYYLQDCDDDHPSFKKFQKRADINRDRILEYDEVIEALSQDPL